MEEPIKYEPIRDIELASKSPAHTLALAIEKGISPDVLNKLLDVQERWEKNQAHKEFVVAMTAFKASAPAVLKKASEVNFETSKGRTQYKYANLGDIVQEITSNLSKHELSASWETSQDDKERVIVTCHITHAKGHRESVTLRGPADLSGNKNPIQAIGSTVSYLQRYTLLAALGLATAEQDDDGIGAGSRPEVKEKTPKRVEEGIKPEPPKPEAPKEDFTFEAAMKKMEEITNVVHLKNFWTKYWPQIKAMPEAECNELTAFKDHLKAQFEKGKEVADVQE